MMNYRTAQNFGWGSINKFDKFPVICQYFPYQKFPFSLLLTANEFVVIQFHPR